MNPYDFAIQMSRDGEKFFRTLTRQVKKTGLRKILVMLPADQVIHGRDFEKMKKTEGRTLPDARNLTGALNPFSKRLNRVHRGQRVDENLPPAELYRRGQELDKECEDFWRKRAARLKDPRLKQAFLRVAEEQRKHHSPYGVGDLGPEAYRFADFLGQTRQRYWQVLPLNPTRPVFGNSPYSSVSSFAGNTLLRRQRSTDGGWRLRREIF